MKNPKLSRYRIKKVMKVWLSSMKESAKNVSWAKQINQNHLFIGTIPKAVCQEASSLKM